MLISTRGRYALRVLADLAEAGGARRLSLHELARMEGISEKYLEQLMHVLVSNGILEGSRGRTGGYRFKRPPEQVTVWEVLELAEGSLAAVSCRRKGAVPCQRETQCRALPIWEELDRVIQGYLSGRTVADLVRRGA